jgi:DNA-binding MarR family transcriptional regulator
MSDGIDSASIETHGPGFMFRRLQQVSVSFFHDQLRPLNLTPLQATVLRILGKQDGLDQASLATKAVVDSSTIKDVVQRLEQHDAVKRARSVLDKRMQLVYLTPVGRTLLKNSMPLAHAAAQKLLAPLSTTEQKQLLTLVAKIVDAHDPEPEVGTRAIWRRKKTEV